MLKAAAERGWLNEKDAVLEALLCLKRAGSGEGRGWVQQISVANERG